LRNRILFTIIIIRSIVEALAQNNNCKAPLALLEKTPLTGVSFFHRQKEKIAQQAGLLFHRGKK